MATVQPFCALRPVPEQAATVASVPYDVISTQEARAMATGKPDSFLHIIRPEIDLPEGIDEHDAAVYEKGAENLRRYAERAISLQEETPSLYVYRLVMDGRAQTGLFGCVAVAEYDDGTIRKHEKTRPDKEDDRTRHILTQRAHAEPVMLTYRDVEAVDQRILRVQDGAPLYDFTADDGVRHTIWRAVDPQPFVDAFATVEKLYVADGHHRCKAASRVAEALRDVGTDGQPPAFAFFPAVLFPMSQMRLLPYNRIVYRLPASPDAFLEALAGVGDLEAGIPALHPTRPGEVCLYLQGQWHRFALPETRRPTVADRLDVARLSEWVLEPLLHSTDPRTDPNIDFVGGIRGTAALERRVDAGTAALAIALYPTRIEELVDVSEAGLLMPPKSTWFEPKLRSGLLVHLFW